MTETDGWCSCGYIHLFKNERRDRLTSKSVAKQTLTKKLTLVIRLPSLDCLMTLSENYPQNIVITKPQYDCWTEVVGD